MVEVQRACTSRLPVHVQKAPKTLSESALQVVFRWRHARVIPIEHTYSIAFIDEEIIASHVGMTQDEWTRQPADRILQTMQPGELGQDLVTPGQNHLSQRP